MRIWYNVAIRGEINAVRIGNFSEIGDGSVLSASASLPVGIPGSITIGKQLPKERKECENWNFLLDLLQHN